MKVHELITRLQNFPMDADVYCLHESSSWNFEWGKGSYEVNTVEEDLVEEVVTRIPGQNNEVIIK